MIYTAEKRTIIYNRLLGYCKDKEKFKTEFVDKLILGEFTKKNSKLEYDKINEYYSKIIDAVEISLIYENPTPDIEKIIFTCINSLIQYEYFHSIVENKDKSTYNSSEYSKQLNDNKKNYHSDTEINIIKIPDHPNDTARFAYSVLTKQCNLHHDASKRVLKYLFPDIRKICVSKKTKTSFQNLLNSLKNLIENPQCKREFSKEEQKKSLQKLDGIRNILKSINRT